VSGALQIFNLVEVLKSGKERSHGFIMGSSQVQATHCHDQSKDLGMGSIMLTGQLSRAHQ